MNFGIEDVVNINNRINVSNVEIELSYILQKFGRDSELTRKTAEMFDAVLKLNRK